MSIPDLQGIQLSPDTLRGCDADPCTEELSEKKSKGIIAGIVLIADRMFFIRSKIIQPGLHIVAVERRDGKERRNFYRRLQADRMGNHAPVVRIKTVIPAQDDFIPQKVVQP